MDAFSPMTGVVVEVVNPAGTSVRAGAAVLILESMKMHHEVAAESAGVVRDLAVAAGDQVEDGQLLFRLDPAGDEAPGETVPPAPASAPQEIRPDLAAALERRRLTTDAARPGAVERRHGTGLRTARENVADLCDPGSFSEYGGLAIAAQRARRSEQDLIENTSGDGIVTGIGVVNGSLFGEQAGRCAVLAYDYTVLAGTQGVRNHRKTDRMIEIAEQMRLPIVLFAEGGEGARGTPTAPSSFTSTCRPFATSPASAASSPGSGSSPAAASRATPPCSAAATW